MVKLRFTLSDVVAMASEVREACADARVVNVYDVDPRTFVLKLNTSSSKVLLLIESGVRFHVTKYDARASEMPTAACAKLRSVLKGKRVMDVTPLGHDRVVLIRFGAGTSAVSLFLEMYATGNVVLTDADFVVTFALRSHKNLRDGAELVVGKPYPAASAAYGVSAGSVGLDDPAALAGTPIASADALSAFAAFKLAEDDQTARIRAQQEAAREALEEAGDAPKKKKKKRQQKSQLVLKQILMDQRSGLGRYGLDVIEDVSVRAGAALDASDLTTVDLDRLAEAAAEAPAIFRNFKTSSPILVFADKSDEYVSFSPTRFSQHSGKRIDASFERFGAAVDEYFRSVADARLGKADENEKNAISKRVDKIRVDQARRVEGLREDQGKRERKAAALEERAEDVDKVLAVINGALSASMRWDEIEAYVNEEKERGSPLAEMVASLDFANNAVIVKLDDDEIAVKLDESAHSSARKLWEAAKKARAKAEKTEVAATAVVAQAEKQTAAQLAKRSLSTNQKSKLKEAGMSTKLAWFTRYAWFVSSDGYLCLCPRDKSQFDRVLFELARPGKDAIVCAERAEGFAPCVVRGKKKKETRADDDDEGWAVSPLALSEAGSFVACRSSAWAKRDRCGTFWIPASDVGRQAEQDSNWETIYDSIGDAFAIRVQSKKYLPPAILELSLTVLFLVQNSTFFKSRVDDKDLLPLPVPEEDHRKMLPPTTEKPPVLKKKFSLEEKDSASVAPSEVAPSSTQRASAADTAKKAKKKKKKGRRKDDEISSDEDKVFDLDVCSRRARRKQNSVQRGVGDEMAETTVEEKDAAENQETVGREEDEASQQATPSQVALLNGDLQSAVSRLSPAKREAWDRVAEVISVETQASMAFEVKYVADEMCDEDAVEALNLLEKTEIEARREYEERLSEARAREKRGGVAATKVVEARARNVPALLSGIARRLVNERKKGVAESAEEEKKDNDDDDTETLAMLSGKVPAPSDGSDDVEIGGAVVVCAPTASTRAYAHALKLTPGNVKKGKAAKDALDILVRTCPEDATPRERDLLRSIDTNEAIGVLVANTKINAAKLNALKADRKAIEKNSQKKKKT